MRKQAHELFAVGTGRVLPSQRALTDEVLALLLRDDPVHAQIDRRDGSIGLLTDDHVSLLCPQHVQRLGPVRRDSFGLAGLPDGIPYGSSAQSFDVHLERKLT